MTQAVSRRAFVKSSLLTAAGYWIGTSPALARKLSANDKLNIGVIGVANRARANLGGVRNENIVALCDIDDTFLAGPKQEFPKAKLYNDFRELLDQKDIDAIVVSTPDHTHAVAAMGGLKSGRHVYCEKPLAHSVYEVRQLTKVAGKSKLVTQMGTQIHSDNNYRRVVELIEKDSIGPVKEVHVWCDRTWSGGERPAEKPAIPSTIHWDLWLGPVPERPYHPDYLPKNWRRWWDFGGGTLGDMACHFMDLPFWALKLRAPLTIEAEGPAIHRETTPPWLIVQYEFGSRDSLPPVRLTWYDGGKRPELVNSGKVPNWKNGVLFVGSKGMLISDYGKHQLLPEAEFVNFKRPAPYIEASIGHHQEWIHACKTGGRASCDFSYAGPLSETVLLGNVAYRSGSKLHWDSAAFKVTNTKAAEEFMQRQYRKGWSL